MFERRKSNDGDDTCMWIDATDPSSTPIDIGYRRLVGLRGGDFVLEAAAPKPQSSERLSRCPSHWERTRRLSLRLGGSESRVKENLSTARQPQRTQSISIGERRGPGLE